MVNRYNLTLCALLTFALLGVPTLSYARCVGFSSQIKKAKKRISRLNNEIAATRAALAQKEEVIHTLGLALNAKIDHQEGLISQQEAQANSSQLIKELLETAKDLLREQSSLRAVKAQITSVLFIIAEGQESTSDAQEFLFEIRASLDEAAPDIPRIENLIHQTIQFLENSATVQTLQESNLEVLNQSIESLQGAINSATLEAQALAASIQSGLQAVATEVSKIETYREMAFACSLEMGVFGAKVL